MSRIVIYVDQPAAEAEAVFRLSKATRMGAGAVQTALNKNTPIIDLEIFAGDFESHAAMLRTVLACLEEYSLPSRIYELPEGETMQTYPFVEKCAISASVLQNILTAAEEDTGAECVDEGTDITE